MLGGIERRRGWKKALPHTTAWRLKRESGLMFLMGAEKATMNGWQQGKKQSVHQYKCVLVCLLG